MSKHFIHLKLDSISSLAKEIEEEVKLYKSKSATKKLEILSMLQAIKDESYIAGLTIDKMGME
jgi:hypothetical protein